VRHPERGRNRTGSAASSTLPQDALEISPARSKTREKYTQNALFSIESRNKGKDA
jgi:hypothetical protein